MSIPFTWIYLIHDPHTRLYKIGKSDNPDQRIKQLCNPSSYGTIPAAPTEYELIEAWLAPEQAEREIHAAFADARVRGEWFDFRTVFDETTAPLDLLVHAHIESEWFSTNNRWVGEGCRLSEDFDALLVSSYSMHERLNPPDKQLLLNASLEVVH